MLPVAQIGRSAGLDGEPVFLAIVERFDEFELPGVVEGYRYDGTFAPRSRTPDDAAGEGAAP